MPPHCAYWAAPPVGTGAAAEVELGGAGADVLDGAGAELDGAGAGDPLHEKTDGPVKAIHH